MRKKRKPEEHGFNVWRSYSDMMAGVLLLFVLIMCVTLFQAQKSYQDSLKERDEKIALQEKYTEELLEKLCEKGVVIAPVMLHVGLGTFRPVKEDKIEEHEMHAEFISVSKESADLINNRKGRVVAVGTTSCRVLESVTDENGIVHPTADDTRIFIYPGYKFKITDALITNFHLPESTLLMLVSALTSREMILNAYAEAISMKYRFFSFGDAMLIE